MVILVTGAFGFLGSAILEHLSGEGHEVAGAGRPDVEIPSTAFAELLRSRRFDVVVHCAGPASVPESFANPSADFRGSAGVLDGMLAALRALDDRPRVVLLSSAAVYGQPGRLPVRESDALAPISPYGFHRLACELLLQAHARAWGLESVALRLFSAYGEGLRRQIMWDICRQAVAEGAVRLEGTGAESRDFIHAVDVARAVGLVIRSASFTGEVFNVGTGNETTIASLAHLLVEGIEPARIVSFSGHARAGDPANWRADISEIGGLGFRPSIDIETGARRYANWALDAVRV